MTVGAELCSDLVHLPIIYYVRDKSFVLETTVLLEITLPFTCNSFLLATTNPFGKVWDFTDQ